MTRSLFLAAILLAGGLYASEKISYDQLRADASLENDAERWTFTIVTVEGAKHHADRIRFHPDHMLLFRRDGSELVHSDRLARIEVGRRFGGWSHRSLDTVKAPVNAALFLCRGLEPGSLDAQGALCVMPVTAIAAPILAAASFFEPRYPGLALFHLAAAPVYLAHDLAQVSAEPKIYEITH